jgi:hypothetical protein
MLSKRHMAVVMGLALVCLMGVAIMAWGQGGTNTNAIREYETRLKKIEATKTPDELMGLAKWCMANSLTGEARSLALDTLAKSPDDVRAKYVLYVLAGGAKAVTEVNTGEAVQPGPTISETDAAAIFKKEGDTQMRVWREIEPILIRTCGVAKCHNALNAQAKWSLISVDPLGNKTLAQNFQTIDRYINREAPAESLLLEKPLKGKDAGHPDVVLRSSADPVYVRISNWIKTLKTVTSSIWGAASSSPPPPPPTPVTPVPGK